MLYRYMYQKFPRNYIFYSSQRNKLLLFLLLCVKEGEKSQKCSINRTTSLECSSIEIGINYTNFLRCLFTHQIYLCYLNKYLSEDVDRQTNGSVCFFLCCCCHSQFTCFSLLQRCCHSSVIYSLYFQYINMEYVFLYGIMVRKSGFQLQNEIFCWNLWIFNFFPSSKQQEN